MKCYVIQKFANPYEPESKHAPQFAQRSLLPKNWHAHHLGLSCETSRWFKLQAPSLSIVCHMKTPPESSDYCKGACYRETGLTQFSLLSPIQTDGHCRILKMRMQGFADKEAAGFQNICNFSDLPRYLKWRYWPTSKLCMKPMYLSCKEKGALKRRVYTRHTTFVLGTWKGGR